eukprot:TRINITY_DN11873_c0_g1_i2.p2 TRINITY_DN11873_c0_g1~~TRINITY_DN11873_c0_g1_i2.p2  ORF type:complete len:124 (+),score=28.83 TRINITY_DN11873_c0_g1_i2:68-439(+)
MAKRRRAPPPGSATADSKPSAKVKTDSKELPMLPSAKGKETTGKKVLKDKKVTKEKPISAKQAKIVGVLMEGNPGTAVRKPVPLSSLTKHKDVAWQWMDGGKWHYPIPIGCTRPLSPFRSDDD